MDTAQRYIDIGVNLTHRSFGPDRPEVIARARAAGVGPLIVTGTSLAHSREAVALCRAHPGALFATAGVHPHEAARCDARTLAELRELARAPEVVAVGECGLDFNRDFSPRPVQERVFAQQIELALSLDKPLFLHERDAHARFLAILDGHARPGGLPVPAVVHCFTGGPQELAAYLLRGFYIGITGWICDERRGAELQRALPAVPLDRLLLETDAPFLLPRDLPRKLAQGRNEPATLPHIAGAIARYTRRTPAEIAAATTDNARRFFRLPAP
ncbi:MAG: TatD family hydrolase [Polyangia bacterium]